MTAAIPQSIDAEMGLLGSCLIQPALVSSATKAGVDSASFYHPPHITIWQHMVAITEKGQPLEFVTLTQRLHDAKLLEGVGGPSAISVLMTFTPTAANWREYSDIVLEKQRRRALMSAGERLRSLAADEAEPLDQAEAAAQEIGVESAKAVAADSDVQHIKVPTMEFLEDVQAAQQGTRDRYRIEMGLPRFEALTHGLPPGSFVVIGAQTSVGKTAFGLQAACGVAFHQEQQRPALIVSLEMTAKALASRVAARMGNVDLAKLHARHPTLSEYEFDSLSRGVTRIAASELYIFNPRQTPTASQLAAVIRMQKIQRPELALVVVDYLQLLAPADSKENRERQVNQMAETLMRTAVGLEVTIIALSQLNDDGRLRESRATGQHARIIGILKRPEMGDHDTGERTLHLDKNSEGLSQVPIPLKFDLPRQTFSEVKTNNLKQ